MREQLRRAARALLDFYATQQYLHQRSADRYDTGLREALQAGRRLRWHGTSLVGEIAPAPPDEPKPGQSVS